MHSLWLRSCVLLAVLSTIAVADAEKHADTHPPTGLTLSSEAGAKLYQASVPGPLLDFAAPRADSGRRELYLLAAPEGAEAESRTLYRIDFAGQRLITVAEGLDHSIERLAAVDLDRDGNEELLVGAPGRLFHAHQVNGSETFKLTALANGAGVGLASVLPTRDGPTPPGQLTIAAVGKLLTLAPKPGGWGVTAQLALPRRATRHRGGVRLTTPATTLLALGEERRFAIGPEPIGHRRLRSLLLPADGGEASEVWSRLPGAEQIQHSWFAVIDGRPVLIVTTNSADKLGVFERQSLRLFSLYADRTQSGVAPWLAAQTTSRRWQHVEPFVSDLDADGDDDLVVLQLDGLGSGKVKAEAFINSGRRSFEARTRSSLIEQPPGGWQFGTDFTGDGLGDLVLHTAGRLEIYPTLPGNSRKLLAKRPLWSFSGDDIPRGEHSVSIGTGGVATSDEPPDALGGPIPLDLDGDGRPELLLAENPQWGFGRLRVIFLPPI